MELHFSRSQKSGMMGGVKFVLDIKTSLTDAERGHVSKYKLGDTLLYEKGSEKILAAQGIASMLGARMLQLRVTASDLVHGKSIECKDIIEMLAAQEQIKEATQAFHALLKAAATFEGEEVIAFN